MKNYIAELRKWHGMSQEEFGKILNVSRSTIGSWENGRTDISLEMLVKISEKFNVSIDWILTGKDHGLSKEEMEIIDHYRAMNLSQKISLHEIARSINPKK